MLEPYQASDWVSGLSAMAVYRIEEPDIEGMPSSEDAQPQRVLIVDDSRLQRKILSSTVKRWGFEVYEAASGAEALEIVKTAMPDIVLSDWMMPEMNGLEFCDAFRELSGDQYGYFILLTSKSEKDEVARGLDAGADDFLTKPVNAHELRARVRAGERILKMQRELSHSNKLISNTLQELQRLYDLLDDDLLEAKKLQQSLIPDRFKSFGSTDVSLMLRQSGHVGGDLVGFFPAGSQHLGLFSIDVSGHGISSALMTARVAGYLSSTSPEHNIALMQSQDGENHPRPPSAVVAELNDLVLDEMETEHYLTMLLAVIDLNSGQVTLCQAGHPHPVLQRASGEVTVDGPGGLPVGLIPGASYSQFDVQLYPGDRLLLLSDGVSECPGPDGTLLGEEGLEELMRDLGGLKGPAVLESLVWSLSDYADGDAFPDDVSGVLVEYHAPAK